MDLSWLPSFTSFIVGILIIGLTIKQRIERKATPRKLSWQESLEKEHALQFVRPQSIPEELFLTIDIENYPKVEHLECKKIYLKLLKCATLPMVNLEKMTNQELKQQFGARGLEILTNYEKNYFNFMDISYEYGSILYDNGFIDEARKTLEMSMFYGCDSSKSYLLLIQIYQLVNDTQALEQLKGIAMKNMKHSPLLKKVLSLLP